MEEFGDQQNLTNGAIWGSIKFINESARNSCYVLIPYLDKTFKSHYSQAKRISTLNKTTKFKIYPIAAGLNLRTILKVLHDYHKSAAINFKISQKLNNEKPKFNLNKALILCLNGRSLAEVVLNQKLIDNFSEKISNESIIFANCEGQPWELSLRFSNYTYKNVLLNMVFSLPDIERSCDLRNHLIFPFKDKIRVLTGFSENIRKLNFICKNPVLIEPQRFITINSEFQFKNKITKVLYFCDLDDSRTSNFLNIIDDFLKSETNIIFGVKYHPASKIRNKQSRSRITVVGKNIKEFDPDTFVFGSQTSSIIQSEYRLVRKFIFQESPHNYSTNPIISAIKVICTVADLKYYLDESKEYQYVKNEFDLNLTQWKKIIHELLNDRERS
jgi:hypothetical protein